MSKPYAESMAAINAVLKRMQAWGAHDAILSLHRVPENNMDREKTWQSFEETLGTVCKQAAAQDIQVYLRASAKDGMALQDRLRLIERVGAPNLALAASTAQLLDEHVLADDAVGLLTGNVGLWLVGAPRYDAAGSMWNANAPIAGLEDRDRLARLLAIAPDVPILLDAVYVSQDAEHLDVCQLRQVEAR